MVDITPKPIPFSFDKNTVVYLVYLLYKSNILDRYSVKHLLKIIEDKHPDDIIKYLVEETNKL